MIYNTFLNIHAAILINNAIIAITINIIKMVVNNGINGSISSGVDNLLLLYLHIHHTNLIACDLL
jgi:hypothetical protein